MEKEAAMKALGTTNLLNTLLTFIKWTIRPQEAVNKAKNIIDNNDIRIAQYAVGYINEFFSKYLAFGLSNKKVLELNQKIDKKEFTKNEILIALVELRRLRQVLNKKLKPKDQIVKTARSFGVSKGIAIGKIINIKSTKQKIPKNSIGVFKTSGPKYTNLFKKCKGIIFLNGSITSHGAILSREFDIPAIISPTFRLRDGATVKINGLVGSIEVVDI